MIYTDQPKPNEVTGGGKRTLKIKKNIKSDQQIRKKVNIFFQTLSN